MKGICCSILLMGIGGTALRAEQSAAGEVENLREYRVAAAPLNRLRYLYIERAQLKINQPANTMHFKLKGRFALSDNSDGIFPGSENTSIYLGKVGITIPPRKLVAGNNSVLGFSGVLSAGRSLIKVKSKIKPYVSANASRHFRFEIQAADVPIPQDNQHWPHDIRFKIGNDEGTARIVWQGQLVYDRKNQSLPGDYQPPSEPLPIPIPEPGSAPIPAEDASDDSIVEEDASGNDGLGEEAPDGISIPEDDETSTSEETPIIRFQDLYDTIFQKKCNQCHNWTYQNVMSARVVAPGQPWRSKLFNLVYRDKMPPTNQKLTQSEKKMIFDWIASGTPSESSD